MLLRAASTRMLDDLEATITNLSLRTTVDRVAIISSSTQEIRDISQTINNAGRIKTSRMEVCHVISMGRAIHLKTHHSSRWVNSQTTTEEATTMVINSNRTLTRRKINRNSKSSNVQGKITNHDPTKASSTPTREITTIKASINKRAANLTNNRDTSLRAIKLTWKQPSSPL